MKITKKKGLIFCLPLAVAGLVFVPSLLAQINNKTSAPEVPAADAGEQNSAAAGKKSGGKAAASGTVFTVKTEDAVVRNLQAYIEVNGNVVSEEQVTVVPEIGGKVVSVRTALGAAVRKGDLLAQVDASKPGARYSLSPVYAPVSGVVVSSPVSAGSTVSTATGLFTIASGGLPKIEALIPEREVGQLRLGLPAEVRLEAFPGEVFKAKVSKLSPVVDSVSRTKSITLRFDNGDPRINPGMFARIKLNTRTYENIVAVPQDAIVENRGAQAVFVLAGGKGEGSTGLVRLREVSAGVTVDGETEIKSGLAAGEKVVTQGQQFLTDGAHVRVLGNKS
ncbi:MAG: efflux RND transporter periplasmic adaptor subunit [Spirochaetaceae bacterium]|jgi:multidrug efflux pump subunit AcrA (membrane-fusion protein)|nr:efflux RND transporter periplasmic adaptor subunit [Spirochaetaceae bacterium]